MRVEVAGKCGKECEQGDGTAEDSRHRFAQPFCVGGQRHYLGVCVHTLVCNTQGSAAVCYEVDPMAVLFMASALRITSRDDLPQHTARQQFREFWFNADWSVCHAGLWYIGPHYDVDMALL